MLHKQLPFYGKRGSIAEINENQKYYQVKTYNIDGKETDAINIKKTYQDRINLFKNYYKEVEEYLSINKEKMREVSAREKKTLLNEKLATIILIVSVILAILPLACGMILGHAGLWMVGKITLLIGSAFSTASIISLKNIKEEKELKDFKNTYNNLEHELKIYKSGLEQERIPKNNKKRVQEKSLTPITRLDTKTESFMKTKKVEENSTNSKVA